MLIEFMKYDDQLYIQEGFRREHVDKAIAKYQLTASEFDKEKPQESVQLQLGDNDGGSVGLR